MHNMPQPQSLRNKPASKMHVPHHTISILIAYIEAYIRRLGDDRALTTKLKSIEIFISPNVILTTRHMLMNELQEFDLAFLHGMITKFASIVVSIDNKDCSDLVAAVKAFLDILPVPLVTPATRTYPADGFGNPNRSSSMTSFSIEAPTPSEPSIASSMTSLHSTASSVSEVPDVSSVDTHRFTPEGGVDGTPIQIVPVPPPPTPDSTGSDSTDMTRETGDGVENDL